MIYFYTCFADTMEMMPLLLSAVFEKPEVFCLIVFNQLPVKGAVLEVEIFLSVEQQGYGKAVQLPCIALPMCCNPDLQGSPPRMGR